MQVPVGFARRDIVRVRACWQTFGRRTSPLTNSPRRASTPGNALLNYLYAVLEAETRIALLTVGLDPGIGFLNADQPSRDSLALDEMEAIRPEVDCWRYRWLQKVQLAARDFVETRDGTVCVMPRLTTQLTGTANVWARHVAPIAERIARRLAKPGSQLPTPLTERKRHEGRKPVTHALEREQLELITGTRSRVSEPRTCLECGRVLTDRRRNFCSDVCREQHQREVESHDSPSRDNQPSHVSGKREMIPRMEARRRGNGSPVRNDGHASARIGKRCMVMGKPNASVSYEGFNPGSQEYRCHGLSRRRGFPCGMPR